MRESERHRAKEREGEWENSDLDLLQFCCKTSGNSRGVLLYI